MTRDRDLIRREVSLRKPREPTETRVDQEADLLQRSLPDQSLETTDQKTDRDPEIGQSRGAGQEAMIESLTSQEADQDLDPTAVEDLTLDLLETRMATRGPDHDLSRTEDRMMTE